MKVGFLGEIFLTGDDAARCYGTLVKLARHLAGPVVLTGSTAADWHLLKNPARRKKYRLNDIDIVVEGLPGLLPSLSRDFLIVHFHPDRERGKILTQLVDVEHGSRVDVFTPPTESVTERLTDFAAGDVTGKLLSAEDLLAKMLSVIYPAAMGQPIEGKYVEHFHALLMVADLGKVRELWLEYRKATQLRDFDEAAEAVRRNIVASPDLLREEPYCQDLDYACQWCRESEVFPLAPRSRIYEILGYV